MDDPYRALFTDDDGPVLVGSKGRAVTFFVKLPEPLLLEDRFVQVYLRPLTVDNPPPDTLINEGFTSELEVSLCFHRIVWPTAFDPDMELIQMATFRAFERFAGRENDLQPNGSGQPIKVDSVHTVVEVYGLVPSLDRRALDELFDRGLAAIRDFQTNYGAVSGRSVRPLTRKQCPYAVFFHHYSPDSPTDQRPEGADVLVVNPTRNPVSADEPPIADDLLEAIALVNDQRLNEAPFMIGPVLALDGLREINREENFWAGVSLLASACESLLNDLLGSLMWEEGARPEDCSKHFDISIAKRINSGHYSRRLGGDWNLDGASPVGEWRRHVALPRNEMLHGAAHPDGAAAKRAAEATAELHAFLRSLTVAAADRYPRTCWMMNGANLTPVETRMAHIDDLLADPDEPNWRSTLARWTRVVHHGTRYGRWTGRSAAPSDSLRVVAVVWPDARTDWVVVDEALDRAMLLRERPDSVLTPAQINERLPVATNGYPLTVAYATSTSLAHLRGSWVAAYRLVPGFPVMVTGEALDGVERRGAVAPTRRTGQAGRRGR